MHVLIDYTNHRGERRERRILPMGLQWGSPWHKDAWVLLAVDLTLGEERHFALKDIHSWKEVGGE